MALFQAMSYSYRLEFVDHILQIKGEMLKEINQQVISDHNQESSGNDKDNSPVKNRIVDSDDEVNSNAQNPDSEEDLKERMHAISNSNSLLDDSKADQRMSESSFDAQEFLFQKRQSLDHFFISVYEKFSLPPYSM